MVYLPGKGISGGMEVPNQDHTNPKCDMNKQLCMRRDMKTKIQQLYRLKGDSKPLRRCGKENDIKFASKQKIILYCTINILN